MKVLGLILPLVIASVLANPMDKDRSANEVSDDGGYNNKKNMAQDPCFEIDCGIGHECDLDDDNKPVCICAHKCTEEVEERAQVKDGKDGQQIMVCSNTNVTFPSLCELKRQQCMCSKRGRKGCDNPDYADIELNYYGPCKDLGACGEFEMSEYPTRMREWLFLIMEELDNRHELNEKSSKMAKAALKAEKKWVIPVIWKICELDENNDGAIDYHEQLPISAPLKPMETCTEDFLQGCDENKDGEITKYEWGRCLGLEEDDIEDKCDNFKDEE